jgi:hypothetical protein
VGDLLGALEEEEALPERGLRSAHRPEIVDDGRDPDVAAPLIVHRR